MAIVEESGSGKITLLNMLGALGTPTSGKVLIDGNDTFSMKGGSLLSFVTEISDLFFRLLTCSQS